MSTPLITDLASRREKEQNLPLRHVRIAPDVGLEGFVQREASKSSKVDRVVGWALFLMAVAWFVLNRFGQIGGV